MGAKTDIGEAARNFLASWLDWLGSRKTKTLLTTVGITLIGQAVGIPAPILYGILAVGGTGVAAQGVADIRTGGSRR